MANDDAPEVDEARDNAVDLTSGLVLCTTGVLLIALFVTFKAMANYFGIDGRLSKVFKVKTLRFKVIGEAYNLTNRVNYTAYQGNIRSALFNQPTAAGRPRSFQLGAQFDF